MSENQSQPEVPGTESATNFKVIESPQVPTVKASDFMYDPNLRGRIMNDFKFHPATDEEKKNAHTSIREHCKELALYLEENVPHGRELSVALTKLEETMHWANAALAKDNG